MRILRQEESLKSGVAEQSNLYSRTNLVGLVVNGCMGNWIVLELHVILVLKEVPSYRYFIGIYYSEEKQTKCT